MLVAAGAVAAITVLRTEPAFYARIVYPLRYDSIVRAHARNYRLDPALLAAVIYQESRFRPDARSPAGAIGLMQLLPDTARGIAIRTGGSRFQVSDLYDPEINVRYGCWYLRHLLDRYEDEETALAAYNAGQTNVDRWRRQGVGIQFAETRHYVERVRELKGIYRRTYPGRLGS
ncbi:MAG: lytic transglycosylase domain-containing protein [Gaiellaceae bacterium]